MTQFLEALYGDLPDDAWWYVWTLRGNAKYTHWFAGSAAIPEAAAICEKTTDANVYYPVGVTAKRGEPHNRATLDQITGIIGLVADVDFKPRGVPNQAAAIELLDALPHVPSYIVHSGHGLQAGWLFREPWLFDTAGERDEAANIALAWGYTVADAFNRAGYELDPVHDLTRVMRVPGTTNVKAEPVPCSLIRLDADRRYNPSEIDEQCITAPPAALKRRALPTVDVSSEFPVAKHELLMQEHDDYAKTWNHTRKDLGNDCSRHDMALASYAAQCGWSDNEITAMLIAHRQRHGKDKPDKIHRQDYYARTIQRARADIDANEARERAADTIEDDNAPPEALLASVGERLGIPLTRVERVTGDPAIYRFWVGGRAAEVSAHEMITQQRFMGEILSVSNIMPAQISNKERPSWRDIVNRMASVAVKIDGGDETTRDGALRSVINEWAESRNAIALDELTAEQLAGGMFRAEGKVWFRLSELVQQCKIVGWDGKLSERVLAQRLRAIGGEMKQFTIVNMAGKRTNRRFWGIALNHE